MIEKGDRRRFLCYITVLFGILAIGIGMIGVLYYHKQADQIKEERQNELAAITDLKVRQIVSWRAGRMADAELLRGNRVFSGLLMQWLTHPASLDVESEILDWLSAVSKHRNYESILFVDAAGRQRLSIPNGAHTGHPTGEILDRAVRADRSFFLDLHGSAASGEIHLGTVVPIVSPSPGRSFIGVLILRVNPREFLYPLVQSWPTPSISAETLLVRRDGNEVVFLNELKFRKNTALSLRLPANQVELPAARAVGGKEGAFEGVDYRGVPVLACTRAIPDSPWFLVAKVDLEEIYGPVRSRARIAWIFGILLVAAVGAVIGMVWNRQTGEFYRRQYETETEKLKLTERYEHLMQNANDIILLFDSEGRIIEVNARALASYGYTKEELIGKEAMELRHPKVRSAILDHKREIESRRGLVFETMHQRKDGTTFPVEVSSSLVPMGEGAAYLAIIRDTSERKQAEARIRRLNRLYSCLSEINQAVVRMRDGDRLFQEACRIAVEHGEFGMAWVGKIDAGTGMVRVVAHAGGCDAHLDDLEFSLDDRPETRGSMGWALKNGSAFAVNAIGEAPEGAPWRGMAIECGFRSSAAVPLRVGGETVAGFECFTYEPNFFDPEEIRLLEETGADISFGLETIRTEKALIESETKYRELVENASSIILRLDTEGRIAFFNRYAQQFFGYSEEEILGRPLLGALIPEPETSGKAPVSAPKTVLLYLEQRLGGESEAVKHSGEHAAIAWTTRTVFDGSGQTTGLLCIGNDITERRTLEEQYRQSQKMEAVGRLAGGIAHDFNNLLGVITGYSEVLLLGIKPGDPMQETIEHIRNAGMRAANLTRQLLAFSRRQILEPQILYLNAVVTETEKMLRRLIGEDIDLVTVLNPDLKAIRIDPGQIEQVIMNLAVNARDAMPEGGRLTIETANVELDRNYVREHLNVEPGFYVMLAVSDTGTGMDHETLSHIFEPFFTTKERDKGTGLGLSTVYGIVKQSMGSIYVYSEPGRGTTFKIYFPKVDRDAEPDTPGRGRLQDLKGTETILVVEDESMLRDMVGSVLTRFGYRVLTAALPEEALRIAEKFPETIHLMVTDVVMPGMSGRRLAEILKFSRPELKTLYISGYTDNAIIHHGVLDAGVSFLQKPFTIDGLTCRVREMLNEAP